LIFGSIIFLELPYETIRQMAETDKHFDQYPRFKFLNDATGVYLQFSGKK